MALYLLWKRPKWFKTQTTDIWNYSASNDVHNFKVKIVKLSLLKDLERCLINSPRKPPNSAFWYKLQMWRKWEKRSEEILSKSHQSLSGNIYFFRLFKSRFVYLMEKAEFSFYVENILTSHFWGLKMSMPNLQLYL